jgi:hypothetical protein
MIPKTKMPTTGVCEYKHQENIYIFRDDMSSDEIKIDKDSRVRCKCFEIKT